MEKFKRSFSGKTSLVKTSNEDCKLWHGLIEILNILVELKILDIKFLSNSFVLLGGVETGSMYVWYVPVILANVTCMY